MIRSLVRENIFKLLFRVEFNSIDEMPQQVNLFLEDEVAVEDDDSITIPEKDAEYIRDKYEKIIDKLQEIDAKIAATSKGWSIDRIGKVELTVLRLGIYEMLYDESIPVGVAIDEAVELAKKFGQDASPSFVNGILATIAKQIDE